MNTTAREVIETHWSAANSRDWKRFAELLLPELMYEVPQTRERILSGEGYLDMFVTWPGNWQAVMTELVCEGEKAVCRIEFNVEGKVMNGISFFALSPEGKIARVTDYWPEPYEPPVRASKHMVRY
jgi:predicted ester cyclase